MKVRIRNPKRVRSGLSLGVDSFADVPGCVGVSWQGNRLEVEFNRDLTAAEQRKVQDRCESETTTEETLRGESWPYLDLKNPATKDNADQIRRLTRLVLGDNETEQG